MIPTPSQINISFSFLFLFYSLYLIETTNVSRISTLTFLSHEQTGQQTDNELSRIECRDLNSKKKVDEAERVSDW